MTIIILVLVIVTALIFAYSNGFHDSATAIATVVSTKVLSPRVAVVYGAILNFAGAFFGTQVAKTVGAGLVASSSIDQTVIFCALLSAIIWNVVTWFYGLPSSSSHALIGGLIGASVVHAGLEIVNMHGVTYKVIVPMVVSPVVGMIFAFLFVFSLLRIFHRISARNANKYFGKLQIISSGLMLFSHGANDTQKTMGIITLALVSFYSLKSFSVPLWVTVICALSMGFGTVIGGWRIIRTMGFKIIKLKPVHGFAATTSAAGILLAASHLGIPLSTTHVISGSIVGAGSSKGFSAVKWNVVGNMVIAWVLTLPICIFLSALIYLITKL
ncbi:MAG: inorganic phosphate transporter [Coxiella sp. DG_40]|nr:MAG: inorganic phosphate transporter [Coxiella sp. DG_40]